MNECRHIGPTSGILGNREQILKERLMRDMDVKAKWDTIQRVLQADMVR